jgi:hypothetical protein
MPRSAIIAIAAVAAVAAMATASAGAAPAASDSVVAGVLDAGDAAVLAASPSNDAFASRAALTSQSGTVSASFTGASIEAREPGVSAGDGSLWWKVTAAASGVMLVAARVDSDYSVGINAYTDVTSLTALTSLSPLSPCRGALLPRDPSRSSDECAAFAVRAGSTYALQLIRAATLQRPGPLTMMFAIASTCWPVPFAWGAGGWCTLVWWETWSGGAKGWDTTL